MRSRPHCEHWRGLPGVSVERPSLLAEALDLVDRGLDFADALHLGAATHCDPTHL